MILMYLRKSRADSPDATVEEVLAKHEAILQEYCVNTYGKPLEEEYIYREVVSGETIQDRPQMRKLLEYITNNDVDGVLVVEPQRLSRGDLVDCGTICRVFKYSFTKVITPKRTFNLADEYDYKFFEMELRQGNEYLEYMKTLMKRGKRQAASSGQYTASQAPYGYSKITIDKKKTLVPNDNAPTVRLIYDYALKGVQPYGIAKKLNEMETDSRTWTARTVTNILKNIHYLGKIKYGEKGTVKVVDEYGNLTKKRKMQEPEIFEGLHDAIIDEDTFNRVQTMLGSYARIPRSKELVFPFASIVKCGICGHTIIYEGGYNTIKCRYCNNRSLSYTKFVDAVIEELKNTLKDISVTVDDDTPDDSLPRVLQSKLQKLEKRMQKIYSAYENSIYSDIEFVEQRSKLLEERENIEDALRKAQEERKTNQDREAFTYTLYQAIEDLKDEDIPAQLKNNLLKGIFKNIEYTRIGKEPVITINYR